MRVIDKHSVEMTDEETRVFDRFDELLGEGLSVVAAADQIQKDKPDMEPVFYRWLRDQPIVTLTPMQHEVMRDLLTMPRPGSAAEIQNAFFYTIPVTTQSVKVRLDKLWQQGWLTRERTLGHSGRRGQPAQVYFPVPGAQEAWNDREQELQAAYREQQRISDELLA